MRCALEAQPFEGRVLDAGSGEGVDLAWVALNDGCRAFGVELSEGGLFATRARIDRLGHAHVVQGDVLSLPFRDESFDGAYSYGVVHHTIDPPGAVREIARTLKSGAPLLLYVYEDFSDRSALWRTSLRLVNVIRRIMCRLPPRAIRAMCWAIAPLVYGGCTWPAKRFRWAARFPYRHNTSVRDVVPDLYDRLAAPVERRYSRSGAVALVDQAGLIVKRTAHERGWMLLAERPYATAAQQGISRGPMD